jgi:hypothetical protein
MNVVRLTPFPDLAMKAEGTVGASTFLDRKKEKLKDNSVKRSILTPFGATKIQKRLKRGQTTHRRGVMRDFRQLFTIFWCFKRIFY